MTKTEVEGNIVTNVTLWGDASESLMLNTKDGTNYCLSVILVDGQPQLKLTPQTVLKSCHDTINTKSNY